jgi:uncharacterized protein (DUF433 family)
MVTVLSMDFITSDPAVRSGRPCIAGTGIRVMDVAAARIFHDQSPDEIAAAYGLSLAQVYAALAYYYEHKPALDEDLRAEIARARALKEQRVGSKPPFLFG